MEIRKIGEGERRKCSMPGFPTQTGLRDDLPGVAGEGQSSEEIADRFVRPPM